MSKEVANQMLISLYNLSKSKLCVCTTGIAGPEGGTKDKPVGLVYIGIRYKHKKIKNSFGVIFDDILAGIYSVICLMVINEVI